MKRISTYLMGLSILAITTLSCSKEEQNETRQQTVTPQTITANVPAGQTYVLSLSAGTTASIVTQARHYQLSQIATTRDGSPVYTYTAQKGYSGADEVTLQQTVASESHSGGCSQNHSNGQTTTTSKTLVIKFDVAN